MKPMILATDGSPSAAAATVEAVALASALGSPLIVIWSSMSTLLRIGTTATPTWYPNWPRPSVTTFAETLIRTKVVADEAGIACDVVHGTGPVVAAICRLAAQRDARMIVVGAHGWGRVARVWHGSVSEAGAARGALPCARRTCGAWVACRRCRLVRGGVRVMTRILVAYAKQARLHGGSRWCNRRAPPQSRAPRLTSGKPRSSRTSTHTTVSSLAALCTWAAGTRMQGGSSADIAPLSTDTLLPCSRSGR